MTLIDRLLKFVEKTPRIDGVPCMECGARPTSMDGIIYDPNPDVGEWIAVSPVCDRCYERLSADEVTECFRELVRKHWPQSPGPIGFETFRQNVRRDKSESDTIDTEGGSAHQ